MPEQTKVRTASNIEAVLTLERNLESITVVAKAISSAFTRTFDETYEHDLWEYLQTAKDYGLRVAGEPPQSGAAVFLNEIRVTPPPALRRIGQGVRHIGGTGTEWTVRWVWSLEDVPHPEGTFDVHTDVDKSSLTLS